MKIYIVRHGESTGDIENRYGGRYNDELTEKGIGQAKDLAKKLSKKDIKFIFSSPLKRAEKTAEIIGEELKIEVDIIDNLRERNQYGPISGLTKLEAKEQFAEEVEKLSKHRFNTFITGSEYYKRFTERLFPTFEKLAIEFEDNNILLVTHGGVIRALLREYFNFGEIDNATDCMIVEVEKTDEEYKLVNIDGASIVSKEEVEKAFRNKKDKTEVFVENSNEEIKDEAKEPVSEEKAEETPKDESAENVREIINEETSKESIEEKKKDIVLTEHSEKNEGN